MSAGLRFTVLALAAAAVGACGSPQKPAATAGVPAVAPAVDRVPPVGVYALTHDIPIVIERAAESDDAGQSLWTLRMSDGDPHPVLPRDGSGWHVPALDIEIAAAEQAGVHGLRVSRYGESVFAPRGDAASSYVAAGAVGSGVPESGGATAATLAALAPRLMIGLNVPGVGIALIRNGEIAWRAFFGVKRSGGVARIDSVTVFEAASMSKPAYTYPFMTLVEDGTIDLDTPLVHYLGEDYIPGDTQHRSITARMVLSHRSGFPNWRGDEGLTVRFTPGTEVGYSGEGFQFLQTAVEAVTGESTAVFTREAFLEPLGLSNASYVWREEYSRIAAAGHAADGTPRPPRPYTEANTAYTLYITPEEYANILIEIMRADRSAPHSLNEATRAMMLEPQHMAPDREPIARGGRAEGAVHYALGWRLDRTPTGDRYWHSGSNSTGFMCYSEFDPETGNGIVIMTNSSSGSPLWRALMNATGG